MEKLVINDAALDLLKPSKESHEPKTPKKSLEQLKTPKRSVKLSTIAKLTSAMKRTSVSEKARSKSTSSELATISEGRLARSKSAKTKKESTKIRMAKALETNLIIDQATAQKFGLPMGYVGKEMDEIDASDQKFSMFEAAIAADLAYYQRSSEDREGKCRSRVSSISDDSVLSGDRQEQLNFWIPGSKQIVLWFYFIYCMRAMIICS